MKLLEKLSDIDFSDAEKDRIGSLLRDPQSHHARLLTVTAPEIHDSDFWRGAQRAFQIKGFRDGHPTAIKKVIQRALDAARNHSSVHPHGHWHDIWTLYRRSVWAYLEDEAHPLYELLKREEFQAGPGSQTEQVLRSILRSLPLHSATPEQVRELYELWGFERMSGFEQLLSSNWVEAGTVRRMIDVGVRGVRSELSASLTSTMTDTQRRLEQQATEIGVLRRSATEMRHQIDDLSAQIAQESAKPFPWSLAQGDRRQTPLPEPAPPERAPPELAAVQARVESLGRQLKELRRGIEDREEREATVSSSPVSQPKMTTALDMITRWSEGLKEAGLQGRAASAAWILLEVIRRSRVIITNRPALITRLIQALPEGECRNQVASPLWLTEADWKDGLAFIGEDAGVPRVLTIVDFDVALQETYLVPALTSWMLSVADRCANRVVLVPSDLELTAVSPRLLELATLLTHSSPHVRHLARLDVAIERSPSMQDFSQSSASLLSFLRSRNVPSEERLSEHAGEYDVSLPSRITEGFVSLEEGLLAWLGPNDARLIALEVALMPWVTRARGESMATILREALKVPDGA